VTALTAAVATARVILVAGPGGVGKTTTAAALGLAGVRSGRRTVVVTVDPARRLADAMGMSAGLPSEPTPVATPHGEVWALMLDPKATFDRIVAEEAADESQRDRVLANEFYRHMSSGLSGTQEYMAVELLHQLVHDDRFDLVVVDTPPSRQALDVVDAPSRLVALLDSRLYRLLTSSSRGPVRALTVAARSFVKLLSGAVGAQVVEDAIDFFATFEGMEDGFVERANAVAAILESDDTHVAVVTTPRPDAVTEAALLAEGLTERGIRVGSVVVNMAHRDPVAVIPAADVAALDGVDPGSPLGQRWRLARTAATLAAFEHANLAALDTEGLGADRVDVPLLDEDIRDLEALGRFAQLLTGA
jgi:anion-transporting  ArsA/GET3 family ATPase